MANWCVGELKIRGKYNDVKKFLQEEICDCAFNGAELDEEEGLCIYKYQLRFKSLGGCLVEPIEILLDDEKETNGLICRSLGTLESKWDVDTESLTRLSKQYNIDFKIYAYEKGMLFNRDFEVHKGSIVKDKVIKFDDYEWECTNPSLGG